jgi:hypothetical protein
VVRPTVRWFYDFQNQHGKLPTPEEARNFALTNTPNYGVVLYDTKPNWEEIAGHSWRAGIDFVVCAHVDEWNLYHNSWDGMEWRAWTD